MAHRRFLIWGESRSVGPLHEAVLHRLDDVGLVGATSVVLDSAHVRAKKWAHTPARTTWTGAADSSPQVQPSATSADGGNLLPVCDLSSSQALVGPTAPLSRATLRPSRMAA